MVIIAAILKIYFELLVLNRKAYSLNRKYQGDLKIKKIKLFLMKIQDGRHENLF